ncbi:protein of unknown function [Taphrina deformans PYCC 5710]|uniref:Major facilitator superfamily (MFS) profile domain-containing protein n=1 Tax=Taphrina deformans (strain PYCC 5710 / ATCC 11124 / CBS 356.35 / IMI 108563 / JCM 9778 / NBRC 8474) TaxID=1097556 RepID=R4XH86_TAPDE|nr:protein of unknown function [Taphrina deformans PYCC 5710]|eukprot:CCG83893.1 protein of unknown function [Taphrina deformans PYCC 5710]
MSQTNKDAYKTAEKDIPMHIATAPDSPELVKKEFALTEDPASLEQNVEQEYPTGFKLAGIMFGLACSIFVVALDQTIIATAIPSISNQFRKINDIGWYGSAYFLTSCALQPTWGKIYQTFSVKWFFILAVVLFELGSLICGVAPSSEVLIIGRAVAGLGVSGIFSGGLTIIAYSVPLEKRPAYMGIIGAMFGIASVAGPLLGGVFTEQITWRWCFYINLPVGAITVVSVVFLVHIKQKRETRTVMERLRRIDFLGAACLLPAVICLLLALQWGGNTYAWSSSKIIGLFVGAGLLLLVFAGVQWKLQDRGTIPPKIIRNRSVWASCAFGAAFGGSFFIMAYYIPLYFQAIKGSSAVKSGLQLLPLMISVVLSSILSGAVITKVGYYTPILIGGAVFLTIGAGLVTSWKVNSPIGIWFSYQVIMGLGAGGSFQIPIIAVQTVLDLEDVPVGTALISFAQSLGGAVFIAVAQSLFSNTLVKGLHSRIEDPSVVQTVVSSGATGFRNVVEASYLPVIYDAYIHSLTASYKVALVAGAFSVLFACCVEFKSVKNKKGMELAVAA